MVPGTRFLCLDFRAVLHGEPNVILGEDGHVVHHAVPEAGIIFLNRPVLLFKQVENGLAAGAFVVNGSGDFVKLDLCLFVAGGQSLVALFEYSGAPEAPIREPGKQ